MYGVVGLLVVVGIILAVLGGMGYFKQKSGGSSQPFVPPIPTPNMPGNIGVTTTLSDAKITSGTGSPNDPAQAVGVTYSIDNSTSYANDWIIRLTYTINFNGGSSVTNVEYHNGEFGNGYFAFQRGSTGLNEQNEPTFVSFSAAYIYTNSGGQTIIGPESNSIQLQIPKNN
jgi:hypothetical protein